MSVFKPVDVLKRETGDKSEWNRHIQAPLEKVKDAMKWPCHTREELFCCSPNLPEASQPQCTCCVLFCLVLIATLLYQTAIKEGYMSNTEERRKLSNGFVFLERLLHMHIIVFHLIYVQEKGFCGLKLQHIIFCSLFQFLILDLTHQRFRWGRDPSRCDKCRLRSLILSRCS